MIRAAALALLIATPLAAKPVPLVTLDWPRDAQPRTTATIKGKTLPVRVALGFDNALLLNLGPAQAANLKAFPIIGKQTVRNPLIPGGEAVARGNMYGVGLAGARPQNVPTVWIDKAIAADADGIVSALSFDAERVVLQRAGNGTVTTLNRKGRGEAAVEANVAGTELSVALDLVSPETVMSATAADALVRAGVLKRGGQVGAWTPFPNVRLPFERLVPAPGARLLGLPLSRPAARISEARAKELDAAARAGTSTAQDDADTLTVTATKRRRGTAWVLIGRDVLDRCSRIELDRPGKRWLLTCDF
ncbi:hypothetical protein [Glacieibacterium frigidum]|uniref:Aspartyl protease n=1 Tax=Glacieibacterium frigidum TaxID=2593303 RepID=A0A552UA17_9SPHN|nr:hypothetical protein [Glacieibacterium frigidum]TRW15039.1 hypothetical protein FMM06_15415 [Glacieibacterium frigidum]